MADPIVPRKLETAESFGDEATALGCMDIQTPQGVVHSHDGPGFMTMLVERPGLPTAIGFFVYDPAVGQGLTAQLPPNVARSVAASLLRMADRVDPRKPH